MDEDRDAAAVGAYPPQVRGVQEARVGAAVA
jgi:hypothetical protein